jgi:hypothetical protein
MGGSWLSATSKLEALKGGRGGGTDFCAALFAGVAAAEGAAASWLDCRRARAAGPYSSSMTDNYGSILRGIYTIQKIPRDTQTLLVLIWLRDTVPSTQRLLFM